MRYACLKLDLNKVITNKHIWKPNGKSRVSDQGIDGGRILKWILLVWFWI
jgi:hypothetical protein